MAFDATTATLGEKRAVLLLAKMYDGGERSVDAEDFPEVLGAQGDELEALLHSMSQSNLIRNQSRDGFSLTAMIVDAADRIKSAPALDMMDSIKRIGSRRKGLTILLLVLAGVGLLLLIMSTGALHGAPPAGPKEAPANPAQPPPVRGR